MTEPEVRSNELLKHLIKSGILHALSDSRGITSAALIDISGLKGLGEEEIAALFPNLKRLSTDDILNDSADIDESFDGLLLLGYSDKLIKNIEHEKKVQAFVRHFANQGALNGQRRTVLVVSSTLPNINFRNPNFPWYNGPFGDSVWTINEGVSGLELIPQQIAEDIFSAEPPEWTGEERIPLF